MSYTICVIKTFHHKGLETFFETGNKKGIIPDHAQKLAPILDRLDASVAPNDMNLPGYKLHRLTGKEEGTWPVWVNGNRRVTCRFEGKDAVAVDYRDYH